MYKSVVSETDYLEIAGEKLALYAKFPQIFGVYGAVHRKFECER